MTPQHAFELFPNVSAGAIKAVALLRDNRDQIWRGEPDTDVSFIYDLARQDGAGNAYYLYAHGHNGNRLPEPHAFRASGGPGFDAVTHGLGAWPSAYAVPPSRFADPTYMAEREAAREEKADVRAHTEQMAQIEERRVHSYVDLALRQQEAHNKQIEGLLTLRGQDLATFQAQILQQAAEVTRMRAEAFHEADRLTRSMVDQITTLSNRISETSETMVRRVLDAERRADAAESARARQELDARLAEMTIRFDHEREVAKMRGQGDGPENHPQVREARAKLEIARYAAQMAELEDGGDDEGSLIGDAIGAIAERLAKQVESEGLEGVFKGKRQSSDGTGAAARRLDDSDIVE